MPPCLTHTHPHHLQYLTDVIYGIYRQAMRATKVCMCARLRVCGQRRDTQSLNPDLTACTPPCHYDTMQQRQAQSYRPPKLKAKSKNAISQTEREEEGCCQIVLVSGWTAYVGLKDIVSLYLLLILSFLVRTPPENSNRVSSPGASKRQGSSLRKRKKPWLSLWV